MTVQEILNVAQVLTFEERKTLIQGLFVQMPRVGGLAGTVSDVDDFYAGKRELRQRVEQSLERTARELNSESGEAC
ncbi:MAG: hypothetical protein M3X11_18705 [Acidobacteriota bacterium]|nr:hypothetical protein [Acidobacteriota bacterium]